ncbi:MAG: hypothetical protein OEW35_05695 [Gammaproteobacteria bacterium]|nr:hypothetical protein [Gammaproteobacteria bacterium]MDH4253712.1 hypothetical protein [Gammaproteobacteria bacterium]MDH5309990.1 hypothetical protein [Gammaproteobacteria bacterium]
MLALIDNPVPMMRRAVCLAFLLLSPAAFQLVCAQTDAPAPAELQDAGQEGAARGAARPADVPKDEDLEAMGAVIGNIAFDRNNVFDLSVPGENNWLYRTANRWHVMTRESVIFAQLLFRQGDIYSRRVIDESERILRRNNYLYDVRITPVAVKDGKVDIVVWTRDLWTLNPGFSVSRKGGENKTRVSLTEQNLLGYGTYVRLAYEDNVDRESTSFEFFDRNVRKSWTTLRLKLADNSDGDSQHLSVVRPFYALDARWALGGEIFNDELIDRFYDLGERAAEYRQRVERYLLFGGRSRGLQQGWVRRWTAGMVYDDNRFEPVQGGQLEAVVPEDRKLVYPFVGFELLEDEFEKSANRDQIERTEDFYLGTRLTAQIGFASEGFGSNRDSLIYQGSYSKGWGSMDNRALLLRSALSGRFDDGDSANTLLSVDARYYRQQSKKRLFFMTLDGAWGNELDLDNLLELGGDTGLRGYPLRYQTGESRALFTIEQRYFTDWYPFRLFRVGVAAFADIGRTWGRNPVADESLGWLKDVGFGLRFAPTRSSGREIVHLDVAFPLDGDSSIDSVQVLLESKRSF